MTYVSTEFAILNGNGIQSVAHYDNGAWNAFNTVVENYYNEYFNYDNDNPIAIARSVVAWRMHRAWDDCSNSDIILAIIVNFACELNKAATYYNSMPTMHECYNELTYFMHEFVNVFGITYRV